MTSEEFWALTPAQFQAIGKRFEEDRKHQDLGFGIVSSVIANSKRDPKKRKKPFQPTDFMPEYGTKFKADPANLKSYWDMHVKPALAAQQRYLEKIKARNG